MHYQAYPTAKDTPNRKQRKAKRKSIFWDNKFAGRAEKAAARRARRNANKD